MRDRYRMGDLVFQHIRGIDNPADIFTKPLPATVFQQHRKELAMMELDSGLR
jgi:hypothetical protein